ncbi:hypothetical protein V6N13_014372 [Hibiscus sabdariffa]|uniref:Uncharacterized protein n=1 Tax=Hibiscus sabdariffa TaxID=183260 RepID=A0ABR2RV84_9ROSI
MVMAGDCGRRLQMELSASLQGRNCSLHVHDRPFLLGFWYIIGVAAIQRDCLFHWGSVEQMKLATGMEGWRQRMHAGSRKGGEGKHN